MYSKNQKELLSQAYEKSGSVTVETVHGKTIPNFKIEEQHTFEDGLRFIGKNNTNDLYCDVLQDPEGAIIALLLYRGTPPNGNEIGEVAEITSQEG